MKKLLLPLIVTTVLMVSMSCRKPLESNIVHMHVSVQCPEKAPKPICPVVMDVEPIAELVLNAYKQCRLEVKMWRYARSLCEDESDTPQDTLWDQNPRGALSSDLAPPVVASR